MLDSERRRKEAVRGGGSPRHNNLHISAQLTAAATLALQLSLSVQLPAVSPGSGQARAAGARWSPPHSQLLHRFRLGLEICLF